MNSNPLILIVDDQADNRYEYEMVLHKDSKDVEFIKHQMFNIKANIHLNRVDEFEDSLKDILFK